MFEKFDIKKNDIITITGAGGKTTLMFLLASELSRFGKVLVTTTTKIYIPEVNQFEKMIVGNEHIQGENKNIFVVAKDIEKNKLTGLRDFEIEKLKNDYDYILIEGDGAKRKFLKEWNENEPCIPKISNKVIGVVNLKIIDMELIEENIHRFELFQKKYPNYIGQKVDFQFLKEYIQNGNFFGNNKNEKYIFINEVSNENEKIIKKLKKELKLKIIEEIKKV